MKPGAIRSSRRQRKPTTPGRAVALSVTRIPLMMKKTKTPSRPMMAKPACFSGSCASDPSAIRKLWEKMTDAWPDYDDYQKKTDRVIPVVVLERV